MTDIEFISEMIKNYENITRELRLYAEDSIDLKNVIKKENLVKQFENILENLKKLTKLEDLEEKLGCPIEIVVKALKDGIFIKNDSCKKYQLDLYNNTNNVWVFKNKFIRNVRLKDYKQSWWLKKDKSE